MLPAKRSAVQHGAQMTYGLSQVRQLDSAEGGAATVDAGARTLAKDVGLATSVEAEEADTVSEDANQTAADMIGAKIATREVKQEAKTDALLQDEEMVLQDR